MAVIQITKIQVRRGPETDLPGAPTSLSPLTFSDALEVGEFGFATDSGRLFIGHDPSSGQANYARTSFPFENIEVLTENSQDTFNRLVSAVLRATTKSSFTLADALPLTEDDDWAVVQVATAPFRFVGPYVSSSIDYHVFSSTNEPIRSGLLRVSHPGDSSEPTVLDDAIAHARLELGGASNYNPEAVYGSLRFRFTVVNTGGADYYQMEYQNKVEANLKLFFRHVRIVP